MWYSRGKSTPAMFSSTALTAEPRSRPSTLAPTSIRRDCWVRSMALGVGARRTSATCSRGICSPPGVSIGSSRMLAALWRVSGVLQTWTSYALPPWKMSPTSWLDAVALRRGQVHLDLQLWYFLLEVRVRVDESGYVLQLI